MQNLTKSQRLRKIPFKNVDNEQKPNESFTDSLSTVVANNLKWVTRYSLL